MLGEPLVETFGADCIVTGLSRHRPANASVDWVEADIGKPAELASALRSRRPDVIVHTAALTNVDECERHPDLAARINRDAVTEIADFCSGSGARLVHVSTDAVFDGTRVGRYTETDLAAPLNVYGRTKLEAEKVALQAQGLVLRTNIFGWRRDRADGLAEWILAGLRAGTTLTMFTDVFLHADRHAAARADHRSVHAARSARSLSRRRVRGDFQARVLVACGQGLWTIGYQCPGHLG
jgi:dTDP-4-dehydrorhamnose reductase